jgi:hypothetical protein
MVTSEAASNRLPLSKEFLDRLKTPH